MGAAVQRRRGICRPRPAAPKVTAIIAPVVCRDKLIQRATLKHQAAGVDIPGGTPPRPRPARPREERPQEERPRPRRERRRPPRSPPLPFDILTNVWPSWGHLLPKKHE